MHPTISLACSLSKSAPTKFLGGAHFSFKHQSPVLVLESGKKQKQKQNNDNKKTWALEGYSNGCRNCLLSCTYMQDEGNRPPCVRTSSLQYDPHSDAGELREQATDSAAHAVVSGIRRRVYSMSSIMWILQ